MTTFSNRALRMFRQNLLLVLTLVGVGLGLAFGFAVRPYHPSPAAIMWIGLPGQLYLRLLKMLIVPLVVSSVITGTASLDPKANGKISMVALAFIMLTNVLGAVLGVVAFVIFKPGDGGGSEYGSSAADTTKAIDTQDIFADLIRNIIPDNLFEATFNQYQTQYTPVLNNKEAANASVASNNTTNHEQYNKTDGKVNGANLLGLIFACTITGIAASSLDKKGRALIDFFEAVSNTVILMIQWFMWATPIGVLSLILVAVADITDIENIFKNLGLFIAAMTVALAVQQLLVLPAVLFVATKRNPYTHLLRITKPWLIGFVTAGTAVAIPEMLRSCEVELGVDKRVSRFVIPFGVTLGAQGSAVFIACSCLFISNVSGMPPTVGTVLIVGVMASVSSMAIPSVPSSSIVTIVMILTSLNIPVEAIALLLAVEFYLDRLRTTSSVVSHTMCAVVTHHICKRDLKAQDTENCDVELTINLEKNQRDLEMIPLKSTDWRLDDDTAAISVTTIEN